ncbi:hypothetical protein R3I93_009682 [Phoxinus phoxinus]|uniref:Uncharacterized protein n=1 Tax=Phoxinus phoxinus TaxID=58324 RepID=A0AAN9D066_9TELE
MFGSVCIEFIRWSFRSTSSLWCGGWNNSPNASQFKYIFRKLMARCGVVKACRGNVTAQDDTEFLPALIDTSTSLSAVDMYI